MKTQKTPEEIKSIVSELDKRIKLEAEKVSQNVSVLGDLILERKETVGMTGSTYAIIKDVTTLEAMLNLKEGVALLNFVNSQSEEQIEATFKEEKINPHDYLSAAIMSVIKMQTKMSEERK
jgi:hypothetical protein